MSEFINFNGVPYVIPDIGDNDWGQSVTDFLVAIPSGALQKTGGLFPLSADVNVGPTFGLLSPYYKSTSGNVASSGVLRLANIDNIEWRNFANNGNNLLGVDSSDRLTYNGTPLEFNSLSSGHIFVGNVSNVATDVAMTGDIGISNAGVTAIQPGVITNADINTSAAIAYTKLNLTGSILNTDIYANAGIVYSKLNLAHSIVNADLNTATFGNLTDVGTDGIIITNGTNAVVGSGTSIAQHTADASHNGYLSSADWTTFNNKQAAGNYITALTGDITASGPGSVAATLATVNSNVGTFSYPTITANAKGLITAISSNTPVTSIAGTSNQIIASAATGAVTLSTPQDIATSSMPTFASETLSATTNQLILGTTRTVTVSATQPATSSRIYTIPDQGAAANFLLDQANYTIAGTWSFNNSITHINATGAIFKELTANGTNSVTIRAPNTVTGSYTMQLPPAVAGVNQVLTDAAGNGVLSWASPGSITGTVNSGTQYQIGYYAANGSTISGDASLITDATGELFISATNEPLKVTSSFAGDAVTGGRIGTVGLLQFWNPSGGSAAGDYSGMVNVSAMDSVGTPAEFAEIGTVMLNNVEATAMMNILFLMRNNAVTLPNAAYFRMSPVANDGAYFRFGKGEAVQATNPTIGGGFLWSQGASLAGFGGGMQYGDGPTFTARATGSAFIEVGRTDVAKMSFYSDSSLTPGNTYTPTERLHINTTGITSSLPLAMGSNKITGLANGTAATDAMAIGQQHTYQIVAATNATGNSSTGTTAFVDTNLTASITPTSASNKILVQVSGAVRFSSASTSNRGQATIKRNSTELSGGAGLSSTSSPVANVVISTPVSMVFLDSPATTSAVTYTVQIKTPDSASDTIVWEPGNMMGSIILTEVV